MKPHYHLKLDKTLQCGPCKCDKLKNLLLNEMITKFIAINIEMRGSIKVFFDTNFCLLGTFLFFSTDFLNYSRINVTVKKRVLYTRVSQKIMSPSLSWPYLLQ